MAFPRVVGVQGKAAPPPHPVQIPKIERLFTMAVVEELSVPPEMRRDDEIVEEAEEMKPFVRVASPARVSAPPESIVVVAVPPM